MLGQLVYEPYDDTWRTNARSERDLLTFRIAAAANGEPDPVLVAHARELQGEAAGLQRRIAQFLDREAEAAISWGLGDQDRAHIRGLVLVQVALIAAAPVLRGMLYFEVPASWQCDWVWRCDYVDGQPTGLGFDR